jgi:flagellar biosynthetic protein FliR
MDAVVLQSGWSFAILPVTARVGGLLLVAPVFGHAAVPVRLRIAMALVVALAVMGWSGGSIARSANSPLEASGGHWGTSRPDTRSSADVGPWHRGTAPASVGELVVTCAMELAIGAMIGWAASLIFAGVELAAAHVGTQMGVSLGEAMGGEGDEGGGPVAAAYRVIAIAVFLLIGGHRELLGGLLDTLQIVPVGGVALNAGVLGMAGALLKASFVLALKVAAPVLIAMLLATVAMGFLHRAMPASHILSTGLPVRAMVGLLVMALSLAGVAWSVQAAWTLTGKTLSEFMVGS